MVEYFRNLSPRLSNDKDYFDFRAERFVSVAKKTTQNQMPGMEIYFPEPKFRRAPLDFHLSFVRMREFSVGHFPHGRVAEWSNAPDSKSGIRLYRIEGSNPSPSAREHALNPAPPGFFVVFRRRADKKTAGLRTTSAN